MSEKFNAPPFLDAIGRKEWRRIISLLASRGLLDPLRKASVEGYALNYQHWHYAEKQLSDAKTAAEIDRFVELSNGFQRRMRDHARDLGLPVATGARKRTGATLPELPSDEAEVREIGSFFNIRKAPH